MKGEEATLNIAYTLPVSAPPINRLCCHEANERKVDHFLLRRFRVRYCKRRGKRTGRSRICIRFRGRQCRRDAGSVRRHCHSAKPQRNTLASALPLSHLPPTSRSRCPCPKNSPIARRSTTEAKTPDRVTKPPRTGHLPSGKYGEAGSRERNSMLRRGSLPRRATRL